MLLAIDVGNTQTVYGVWDGKAWIGVWRRATSMQDTEDEIVVWLKGLFELSNIPFHIDGAICASVVPALNQPLTHLVEKWFDSKLHLMQRGTDFGLKIDYTPETAVGADRVANAIGALDKFSPPLIVVDFGTATTFDTVDANGTYVGGAILPGVIVATQALVSKTSKLPQFDLVTPKKAIGKTTVESLQSGVMIGYAGAVDAIARRIANELGGKVTILSTGGLGSVFVGLCESIETYDGNLTLDGLRIAYSRI